MKRILYCLIIALVGITSCNKQFDELQINPNRPTSVPASLILSKQLNDLSGGLGGIEPWGAVARFNQFFVAIISIMVTMLMAGAVVLSMFIPPK